MGGKGSPPPAPNYSNLASQQSELDRSALTNTTYSNRPNQVSPWGSTTWGTQARTDPATGERVTQWTQNQNIDPRLRPALNNQMGLMGTRSGVAGNIGNRLRGDFAPVNYDQFRDVSEVDNPFAFRQASEDAAYERATSRLDPRFAQEDQALEVKLRGMGLRSGDEAYDTAMANQGRTKTDAYQTAQNEATQAGRAESQLGFNQQQSQQAQTANLREQQIIEFLRGRGQNLSDINNLLAGQGVQPASQASFTGAGPQSAPNMMGAANAQYGAEQDRWSANQAQKQGQMQGLTSLATTGMMMASDRRAKTDINRIGTWRSYPLYTFKYLWGDTAVGVMSDEVNQDAVVRMSSGYDAVDYNRVGV